MSLSSRQRLGSYEIQSLLGAGGMGEVYRATDTKLGRDVALKILPQEMSADPDRLARFTREARAVAALNHPNIVTIFAIEEHGGVPFMTMELIEGRTLDQGIPGDGLSLARFFDIAIALADALSAAHRKHIIHRDLKPSTRVGRARATFILHARHFPEYRTLRSDPRFAAILREMDSSVRPQDSG